MAHRKLTTEQVAELIRADEAEGEEGELPDSDCSVAEIDSHQPIIPKDNIQYFQEKYPKIYQAIC